MSIDEIKSASPVNPVNNCNTDISKKDGGSPKKSDFCFDKEDVNIFNSLENIPTVDLHNLKEIKKKIRKGLYNINYDKLAKKIIELDGQFLEYSNCVIKLKKNSK